MADKKALLSYFKVLLICVSLFCFAGYVSAFEIVKQSQNEQNGANRDRLRVSKGVKT